MEEKDKRAGKGEKRGFYVALAICLAAIGIAAWSAYDTVSGFLEPKDTASSAVTAAPEDDDPESTVSSGHGRGTASSVDVEEPAEGEPEATAAPAAAPEEEDAPANTEPAYTESKAFTAPVKETQLLTAFSEVPVYSDTMRDFRAHMGVDFAAEHGETVKAAANGIVKEAYTDMLLGNTLVIEHGAYDFYYCGLGETFLVDPGETVTAGQDIGSVTAAPFEAVLPSHLHLEVKEGGVYADPYTLLTETE